MDITELRHHIFKGPMTPEIRPYLVEYIITLTNKAAQLSQTELLDKPGHGIAMDICSALIWQDPAVSGSEIGVKWITEQNEPILSEILDIIIALDADAHNPQKWINLFRLAEQLT